MGLDQRLSSTALHIGKMHPDPERFVGPHQSGMRPLQPLNIGLIEPDVASDVI